jgi:hypothetical protein
MSYSTAYREAVGAGLGFRPPDGADLRVGENDLWGAPVVGGVAERRGVVGFALGAGGDHVAAHPGLVLAHVGEQVAPVDVADGVEPAVGHARRPHAGVHLDRAVRGEADRLQADVAHGHPAAEAHEDLVGLDPRAVIGVDGHRAARDRAGDPGGRAAEAHVDARLLERLRQQVTGERLGAGPVAAAHAAV